MKVIEVLLERSIFNGELREDLSHASSTISENTLKIGKGWGFSVRLRLRKTKP